LQSVNIYDTQKNGFSLFNDIQPELDNVELRMRQMTVQPHPALKEAVQYLLDSGGKRVRPAVTLNAGIGLGASRDKLVNLAAATEMLHTATLVHDDIIDGSLLRRGVQTLNATWSPGATILTGDFIFARAAQLAAATGSVRVMSIFAETLMVICNGELYQLFEGRTGKRERDAYYDRIYAKTASLFALASEAAAVLAASDQRVINQMRLFGEKLGMAFQIVDDVLDFVGQESNVGKPLGSDLRQGLVTLPTLYFLERYPNDGRLLAVLNGHKHDKNRMEQAISAIRDSEAIELALQEARQFVDEARQALLIMPASAERDSLAALADYVVDRSL